MTLECVILAAGQGSRMRSSLPKVLHRLGGKPLLGHVLSTAYALSPAAVTVVTGYQAERVEAEFNDIDCRWVRQDPPSGTGHAVQVTLPYLFADTILVLLGDTPLLPADILKTFIQSTPPHAIGMLTTKTSNPTGYGRIIRNAKGGVIAIKEEVVLTESERAISEINTGIYLFPLSVLKTQLPLITLNPQKGEYFLTDIIAMAVAKGTEVVATTLADSALAQGINTAAQLAEAEATYQHNARLALLEQGVRLNSPETVYIRGPLSCGSDVEIDTNVIFEGENQLAEHVTIGANTIIKNSSIGAGSVILPFSVLEGVTVGAEVTVGPFARLRPGTVLQKGAKVGNFVETKNVTLGEGSKACHLSYLGDATIGRAVNIGAGTITCNYDGIHKHKTIIEDGVFVGSDCQLVAPVTIGKEAMIAAGTTVWKDVPEHTLVLNAKTQEDRKR